MTTDGFTKLVLTVIAICLALMVVQGYRGGARASASGSEEGRYRLTVVPMARVMVRFDSDTGKAWKATLPDMRGWAPIADSPAEMLEEAAPKAPEPPAPDVMAPEIMIEGMAPEGMAPEAKAPEAKAPEAKAPEAKAPEDVPTP